MSGNVVMSICRSERLGSDFGLRPLGPHEEVVAVSDIHFY